MHRQHRAAPGETQSVRHATAHHQGANQARPGGIGDDVRFFDPGLVQHPPDQRQQAAHVIAGGDLRHHAAVGRVQVDLAMQRMGDEALGHVVQRHARLIAAGFDAENVHSRGSYVSSASLGRPGSGPGRPPPGATGQAPALRNRPFWALQTADSAVIMLGCVPAQCRVYLCENGIPDPCQVFA